MVKNIDMTKTVTVKSVGEYITCISESTQQDQPYIYRGQSDCKWNIESSAYRYLRDVKMLNQDTLIDYHIKLLNDIRRLRDTQIMGHNDIELLAHLQHNYAKTNLVDYTYSPLVALWFACNDNTTEDAAVYFIEESFSSYIFPLNESWDINSLFRATDKLYVYHPSYMNQRIINQQSVFLISWNGVIDKMTHKTIVIQAKYKAKIIEELRTLGFSRKTLFPDVIGCLESFKYDDNINSLNKYVYSARRDMEMQESDYDAALKKLDKAAKALLEKEGVEAQLSYVYQEMGYIYLRKKEYDKSLKHNIDALRLRNKTQSEYSPYNINVLLNLVQTYIKMGDYKVALTRIDELEKQIALLPISEYKKLDIYNNKGIVLRELGRYHEALSVAKQAYEICSSVLGNRNVQAAYILNNIASCEKELGNYQTASAYYNEAHVILENYYGINTNADIAYSFIKFAELSLLIDKEHGFQEAETNCERAIEILKKQPLPKSNMSLAYAYKTKADAYIAVAKYDDAIALCVKAENIYKEYCRPHPKVAYTLDTKGRAYECKTQYDEAISCYAEALNVLNSFFSDEHPDIIKIKEKHDLLVSKTSRKS